MQAKSCTHIVKSEPNKLFQNLLPLLSRHRYPKEILFSQHQLLQGRTTILLPEKALEVAHELGPVVDVVKLEHEVVLLIEFDEDVALFAVATLVDGDPLGMRQVDVAVELGRRLAHDPNALLRTQVHLDFKARLMKARPFSS